MMEIVHVPWTEEEVAELTELWNAGHTARLIGDRLFRTRLSVIGKARMRWSVANSRALWRDGERKSVKRRRGPGRNRAG
jgi:hypothetical protein